MQSVEAQLLAAQTRIKQLEEALQYVWQDALVERGDGLIEWRGSLPIDGWFEWAIGQSEAPDPGQYAAVLSNAIKRWYAHRPIGWTDAQHVDNPTVNIKDDSERAQAIAVAAIPEDQRRVWL